MSESSVGWISQTSPLWSRGHDNSCRDSERLFRWLGVEKMIMGHTPQVTYMHGKVHEMCAGRSVIADVAMSRGYREDLPNATIVVVEIDSQDSAAGTVFYEDIKSGARSCGLRASTGPAAPLFAPRALPSPGPAASRALPSNEHKDKEESCWAGMSSCVIA